MNEIRECPIFSITKRGRLLIVEDDAEQRHLLAQVVGWMVAEVDRAASLEEAANMLRDKDYQIVLSDVELGDGEATALFENDLLLPSRTILMSGSPRVVIPDEVAFVRKPVDVHILFKYIKSLIGDA